MPRRRGMTSPYKGKIFQEVKKDGTVERLVPLTNLAAHLRVDYVQLRNLCRRNPFVSHSKKLELHEDGKTYVYIVVPSSRLDDIEQLVNSYKQIQTHLTADPAI